jgi:hypothetical protein
MIFKKVWSGIKNIFSTEVELGEPFSFPKIKLLNDVIKDLKIDDYAKKDGEKNLPRSDRKSLGATEEKILGFYNRLTQDSKVFGTEYSNNVKQNIDNSGIMSVYAKIDNYKKTTTNWFNEKKKESKNFKYFTDEKIKEAVNRYKEFRKNNSLNRRANYPVSTRFYTAQVFAIFVLECFINGWFLKEVTTQGLLGGLSIAIIISVFNVGFGYLYGKLIFPFKNHINSTKKIFGNLSIIVISIWFLFVNFFTAHYREEVILNNNVPLTEIFQKILENPMAINDIKSFMLLILGFAFGIAAVGYGYKSDDPYPGFGKVQRFQDETMRTFAKDHWIYFEECTEQKNHLIREIRNLYQEMRLKFKSISKMLDLFTTLDERYNIQVNKINSECKQAIMHYRDENERSRSDRAPKYFEKKFNLPETSELNINIKDQDKMVNSLKIKITNIEKDQRQIVKHIESSYEDAISKVKDLVDYQSEALNEE